MQSVGAAQRRKAHGGKHRRFCKKLKEILQDQGPRERGGRSKSLDLNVFNNYRNSCECGEIHNMIETRIFGPCTCLSVERYSLLCILSLPS